MKKTGHKHFKHFLGIASAAALMLGMGLVGNGYAGPVSGTCFCHLNNGVCNIVSLAGGHFDLTDVMVSNNTGSDQEILIGTNVPTSCTSGGFCTPAPTYYVPAQTTVTQTFTTPLHFTTANGATTVVAQCSQANFALQVTVSGKQ